ncbi:MAG: DUF1819 family protein [Deltaproteobacteria bacterium]|nr:DUF1819 family protein [Deltaproteobacteria bacterium]
MSILNQINKINSEPYRLSFTSVSLRPELARIAADAYLACGTWAGARQQVLANNAFQSRTKTSLQRMEREIRPRLELLTKDQIVLLAGGTSEERAAMAWLAAIKYADLVREFAADVLRSKLADFDTVFRPSDYSNFIAARLASHPELAKLTESSSRKIRRVLLLMLTEAGMIREENRERRITRSIQTERVIDCIVADDAQLLVGFLWSDEEIAAIRKGK